MAAYFCSSNYHMLVPVSYEPPSFTKPAKAPFTINLVCTPAIYKQLAGAAWFLQVPETSGRSCTALQPPVLQSGCDDASRIAVPHLMSPAGYVPQY